VHDLVTDANALKQPIQDRMAQADEAMLVLGLHERSLFARLREGAKQSWRDQSAKVRPR
jgi:hypothetical protein